jgi:hypothetical protein
VIDSIYCEAKKLMTNGLITIDTQQIRDAQDTSIHSMQGI